MALPREVKIKVSDRCFDTPILLLGKVGEHLATKVVIDASEWQGGEGEFQLLVKRADEEMFTATIEQANGVVTWLIPSAEIGAAGYGEIELNYIINDAKMKSARVDTRVFSSIEIDSLPPNGTTWSQMVLAAVQDARDAARAAEDTQADIELTLDDAVAEAVSEGTERAEHAARSAAEEAERASEIADSVEETLVNAVADATKTATDAANAAKNSSSAAASSASAAAASATNAAKSASAAATSATNAANSASSASNAKTAAEKARDKAIEAHDEIFDILNNATILDTSESCTFNADGLIATITHKSNSTGAIVRTDVFTYNGNVVTEVRTAADGRTQTNVYDLEALSLQFNV